MESCSRGTSAATMWIVAALYAPTSAALTVGLRAVAPRAPAPRADFASFEKSFNDAMYEDERLDKNKALLMLKDSLPGVTNGFKADGLALREGIDEAREAGASVMELKRFIEALQKADPTLVTEVDEALLFGADQVAEFSLPQPAKQPPDSYVTADQFEALRLASMSPKPCWDATASPCPEELRSAFSGRPQIVFSLLRHPRLDPTPAAWEAVRTLWPILQGVPDAELQKNLVECRKEPCDIRSLV